MADYIRRDEIFSVWRSMPKPASISSLTEAINRTPAADVEPVRPTGHWEIDDGRNHCHCTNCLFGRDIKTQIGWDYCPNCGAKNGIGG